MRTIATLSLLVACIALAGCGGSDRTSEQDTAGEPGHATTHATTHDTSPADHTAMTGDTESVATVAGAVGCGHCNYHVTGSCAVVIKTGDGSYVVVDGVAEDSDLWNERFSGKRLEVVGTLAEIAGQQHVAMESYTLN